MAEEAGGSLRHFPGGAPGARRAETLDSVGLCRRSRPGGKAVAGACNSPRRAATSVLLPWLLLLLRNSRKKTSCSPDCSSGLVRSPGAPPTQPCPWGCRRRCPRPSPARSPAQRLRFLCGNFSGTGVPGARRDKGPLCGAGRGRGARGGLRAGSPVGPGGGPHAAGGLRRGPRVFSRTAPWDRGRGAGEPLPQKDLGGSSRMEMLPGPPWFRCQRGSACVVSVRL